MRTKLTLLFLLFLFTKVNAQKPCGTISPVNYQTFENNVSRQVNPEATYCIDIFFHIVRQSDGTGGFSPTNLNLIIRNLNREYNRHNIFFSNVGHDFINSNFFFDIEYEVDDDTNLELLYGINNKPNAFDFYLTNSLTRNGPNNVVNTLGGVAKYLNLNTIVTNTSAFGNTPTHEVGHCLNLLHTHETFYGIENIERSGSNKNCDVAGDKLCDTPADPNLFEKVDFNCNYTETEYLNGLPYQPDTNNFMSYSRRACRDEFTNSQVTRMKNALENAPLLQDRNSSSCAIPEIIGDEICTNTFKQYSLQNVPNGATVNWSVSSNLIIQFSSSSFINVITQSTSGTATITATVNGFEVVKEIVIGSPEVTSTAGISGGYDNVGVNTTSQFQAPYIKGVEYYWEVVRSAPDPNCANQPGFQPYGGNTFTSSYQYGEIDWGNCPGDYRVSCFAQNECGQTFIGRKWVSVYDPFDDDEDPCNQGPIDVYPNPFNGNNVTVNRYPPGDPCNDGISMKNGGFTKTNVSQLTTIINEVHIYTLTGLMVYNNTFTGEYEFTINNLGLTEGYYILELITEDNNVLTTQLMVDQ